MRVELVEDVGRLEQLRDPWDELAVERQRPYAAPAWQLAWWHEARPPRARLLAGVVWQGQEVAAIAPLYVASGRVAHCAPLAAPAADGIEPLARAGSEADVAAPLARALGEAVPRPFVLTLRGLPLHSPWPRLLAESWPGSHAAWLHREPPIPEPEIDLHGRGAQEWFAGLSANTRSQLRRRRRKLDKAGAVVRESRPDELHGDIQAFVGLHRSRWDWRGGSAVLGAVGVERMVARAATELAGEGRFRLYAIDLEGRTISTQIVLAAGGRATHWLGGFDDRWSHLQPGVQAIVASIEDGFVHGDEIFDLGAGAHAYKSSLADSEPLVATTAIVPRGRGYVRARVALLPRHLHQAAASRVPEERRRKLKQVLWSVSRRRRSSAH